MIGGRPPRDLAPDFTTSGSVPTSGTSLAQRHLVCGMNRCSRLRTLHNTDDFPITQFRNKSALRFYYTFNNFLFHRVTKRSDILPLLFAERHEIEGGMRDISEPFVNEMQTLAIPQDFGLNKPVKFSFFAFIGDNKAANELAGCATSFRGKDACRSCHVSYSDLQADPLAMGKPRIELPYSFLTELNPSLSAFPPDIFNDFHEGIIKNFFVHALKLFDNNFLMRINHKIDQYKWKEGRINCIIGPSVNGTGAQIFDFFIFFPLIFEEGAEFENFYGLSVYILLRKILNQVMASTVDTTQLNDLRQTIDAFLNELRLKFPSSTTTYKMHYLRHYPDYMEKLGPLWRYGSLRFKR